jgi:predicted RNA-binding Zn-ribbon protein involved in translation (DUF1610 family)
MFNFLRKKPENISRTTPGFEESERKTPKAGTLLLIVMFIAGLFFGWRALDDLGSIPAKPSQLSSCAYTFRSAYVAGPVVRPYEPPSLYRDYGDPRGESQYLETSKCQLTSFEQSRGIEPLLEKRRPIEAELQKLRAKLAAIGNSLWDIAQQRERLTREYGVGLQEKQGNVEKPVFPTGTVASSLEGLLEQERVWAAQKSEVESQVRTLEAQLKPLDERLRTAYAAVFRDYNKALRWYEFKVFLLQLLFILPFFWLSFWGYLKLHRKSSPYTIIVTAILAVAAVLLLRIFLFWFWGLFLERVIEVIMEWFRSFQIVRTIIFYGGMLLSFAAFGGAVYFLQKKVFDPRRVAIRRFRAKQCPQCQTNLDLSVFFCPNCGHQLKEKCEKCGQARFVGMPSCPYCGTKKAM